MRQLVRINQNRVWRRSARGLLSGGWIDCRLEPLEKRYVLSVATDTSLIVHPIDLVPVDPPIVVDGGTTDSGDTSTDPGNSDSGDATDTGDSSDNGDGSTDSGDATSDAPPSVQV